MVLAAAAAVGVVSGAGAGRDCVVTGEGGLIPGAACGAGERDVIHVHAGTNARECGWEQATYAGRRGRGCARRCSLFLLAGLAYTGYILEKA